jgi:hypothetical protein
MLAQPQFHLSQLIGQLPLTLKTDHGDSKSYLYTTPEGHELSILLRKDSTVHTFLAFPARKVSPESERRAFAKSLMINAFGVDTSLSNWFDRVGTSLNADGDAVRRLNYNGWRLMLLYNNHAISRLIARSRNANERW